MWAIGDIEERNATIGSAREDLAPDELDAELSMIQNWLFDLGAELASPEGPRQYRAIGQLQTVVLEASIDRQTEQLEPLRSFILPGGSDLGARLHVARCVCRRAERSILELNAQESVGTDSLTFINRLSDWLFVAARTANRLMGVEDVKWQRIGD